MFNVNCAVKIELSRNRASWDMYHVEKINTAGRKHTYYVHSVKASLYV